MTNLQAIILGLVQGATEYLPISSSAHLVLVPHFLQWNLPHKTQFIFDVLVQLGTLLGVFVYFAQDLMGLAKVFFKSPFDLKKFETRTVWLLGLATIPAGACGLLFKDLIEGYFSSTLTVCLFLVVTAFLLVCAEIFSKSAQKEVGLSQAIAMGCFQVFALFPGISRSGSTIAAGIFTGAARMKAARFSFLMSIPVMLGASLVAMGDLVQDQVLLDSLLVPISLGFVASAVSGYIFIKWFLGFIRNHSLYWFAAYCLLLSLAGYVV